MNNQYKIISIDMTKTHESKIYYSHEFCSRENSITISPFCMSSAIRATLQDGSYVCGEASMQMLEALGVLFDRFDMGEGVCSRDSYIYINIMIGEVVCDTKSQNLLETLIAYKLSNAESGVDNSSWREYYPNLTIYINSPREFFFDGAARLLGFRDHAHLKKYQSDIVSKYVEVQNKKEILKTNIESVEVQLNMCNSSDHSLQNSIDTMEKILLPDPPDPIDDPKHKEVNRIIRVIYIVFIVMVVTTLVMALWVVLGHLLVGDGAMFY